jgi:3-oxoacyl-[acyl-carrier protein] reductase
MPEEVAEMERHQAVLGQVASIEDIAAQVVMFCRAESITGQVLVIDGGIPGGMR